MSTETTPIISEVLHDHFAEHFDPSDVEQLAATRYVDIPYAEGEQVAYSRLNEGNGVPTLIVSGFTESIPSKGSLALELTNNSDGTKTDVLIVDQQRVGTHVNAELNQKGRPTSNEATEMQALNYLAVLEAENVEGPIRIVAHSYGSLIVQKMIQLANQKAEISGQPSALAGADIIMVAPSGSNEKESLVRLGGRFAHHSVTENLSKKNFPDKKGEMMKSCVRHMFKNIRRTWQEILALSSERVNYKELVASNVGSIAVMGFHKDRLFPQRVYKRTTKELLEAGVPYLTPIEITEESVLSERNDRKKLADARISGKIGEILIRQRRKKSVRGSTHNDDSFTPSRTANAVKQLFNLNEENRLLAEQREQ